jgi:hypothetical protein
MPHIPGLGSRVLAALFGPGIVNKYLLRDLYTLDEASPITDPRTAQPGPGAFDIVKIADGTISIVDNQLTMTRPSDHQGYGNYGFVSLLSYARKVGRCLYCIAQSNTFTGLQLLCLNSSSLMGRGAGIFINYGFYDSIEGCLISDITITPNVNYKFLIIERALGYACLIRGGSEYPAWTLLWINQTGIEDTLWPALANYNADCKVSEYSLYDLPAPFNTDYDYCSAFNALPVSGDIATGTADALQFFTWTPAANETLSIYFRRTDDNNCYRLDCSQVAGTIKLYRRASGVDTELDSGKTQTWSVDYTYRIGVIYSSGQICVFVGTGNAGTAAKHVVSGETFNLTTTGIKIAGFSAGANWEVYPRYFAGTDLMTLGMV